ncbi:hypothetical protein [Nonomuraea recticatena]|uniref:hypothetical protein n=1 Tax=Nonomuraea recticatena TaxID=46178 RepID=UPI0031F98608
MAEPDRMGRTTRQGVGDGWGIESICGQSRSKRLDMKAHIDDLRGDGLAHDPVPMFLRPLTSPASYRTSLRIARRSVLGELADRMFCLGQSGEMPASG